MAYTGTTLVFKLGIGKKKLVSKLGFKLVTPYAKKCITRSVRKSVASLQATALDMFAENSGEWGGPKMPFPNTVRLNVTYLGFQYLT